MSASLFDWQVTQHTGPAVWRPRVVTAEHWPPDYDAVYRWRTAKLLQYRADPALLASAHTYYRDRPGEWIMHWTDTYDPRNPTRKWMPFIFFPKQQDLIDFLESCSLDEESGLIEKARDMGATWICCGYTLWRWKYIKGDAVGWGSRKQDLVDKIGDPDSIFEKIRLMRRRLPPEFRPKGFNEARHDNFLKMLNPENGAIIGGEAGDMIGRGGRKSMYFKDEAAHYERPEKIESALGDNTNVQIDISSVNGLGNVFHRRAEHAVLWERGKEIKKGFVRKFIMDWRDHPAKTQEWYDTRKAKYEREGMLHVFAQEVDRNYSAAISNTVIPYEWIRSAVDAHIKVPYIAAAYAEMLLRQTQYWFAGLDVADEGNDRNALAVREWIIWRSAEEWGSRDPAISARMAIDRLRPYSRRIECMYDSIGVGAGVKGEYNRLTQDEGIIKAHELPFVPWNAGAGVLQPLARIIPDDEESLMNKDFFDNLKAQAWWSLRTRFYKTHKAVTEGIVYPVDDLVSLDSMMPALEQLCKELAQPTHTKSGRLKMIIEKKPEGTKSPNLADAGMQMYFPVPSDLSEAQIGNYGH